MFTIQKGNPRRLITSMCVHKIYMKPVAWMTSDPIAIRWFDGAVVNQSR